MENQQERSLEEVVREAVEGLLQKMGFDCEIEVAREKEEEKNGEIKEVVVCNIKTEESNFLIGQYGVNLQSLQHIARILVRKQADDRANFILDVNHYRKEKNISIVTLAKNVAEQALNEKRAIVFRPMSPYERRLVHMELSKNSAVVTESIGEGEDRKVVVKPAEIV
ncbi:MAG: Single-stranded nucleic acid binding R3H domain protein [Candidatus Moranbacteria bacterium GW2011_GWA2_39_41]|nr:MAG: Single-stranded nucleic acid binding R3H domain protein [Candidatus Moranbacteria bacterium GW2011_GWA2_39_41]